MAKLLLTSYKKLNNYRASSVPKRIIINAKNVHKVENSNSPINPILLQYDSSRLYPSVRYDHLLVDDMDKEINGVKSSLYQEVYNIEVNVTRINLKEFSPFKTMTINLEDIAYIVENDEGFAQLQNVEIVNEGHPVHQFIDTTLTFGQILLLIFKARPCVPCSDEDTPTQEECCGNLTRVTTVGDWRALRDNGMFNYLVLGGAIEDGFLVLYWIEITDQLDSLPDDTIFSEELNGVVDFFFAKCSVSMLSGSTIINSSSCDCQWSNPVQTVGELLELYDAQRFNFVAVVTDTFDFQGIILFELTSQMRAYLESLPPDTSIDEALEGSIFEGAAYMRLVTCNTNIMGDIDIPPFMDIDSVNIACNQEGEQVGTVVIDYASLEAGDSIHVYGTVGGVEIEIATPIVIVNDTSGTKVITLTEDLDTGNNNVRVVVVRPGDDNLEDSDFIVVEECDTPPAPTFQILNVTDRCEGVGTIGLSILDVTFSFTNIPAGAELQLQAKIAGNWTEIFSTSDFVGTFGTDGTETLTAASGLYDEVNQIRYILTLGNTIIFDNTFDFTDECRNALRSVSYLSSIIECESQQTRIQAHLTLVNVPTGTTIFIYSLVGGVEAIVGTILISNPGSDLDLTLPYIYGIDYGDNYLRIRTVYPDLLESEETEYITVPYCGGVPALRINELNVLCDSPNIVSIDMIVRWDLMPEIFSIELYSLVGTAETLLTSITPIAAGSATGHFTHFNTIDSGSNYIKLKVTLTDLTVIETTRNITAPNCAPLIEFSSAAMQCEYDLNPAGLNTIKAHVVHSNIPNGATMNMYVVLGGIETLIATTPVILPEQDLLQAGLTPQYDAGANYIKLELPLYGYTVYHYLTASIC